MDQFAKLVLYGGRPDLLRPPQWRIDEKVWGSHSSCYLRCLAAGSKPGPG
jgi:hypothetical protein